MKTKYLFTITMFLLCIMAANTKSQLVFLNQFNGGGGGTNVSNAVTTDASGNTYVTGYTTNLLGDHDITTIKYDATGRLVWSKTYNGGGTDEAYAITLDASNNVYITGITSTVATGRDMIIIKYNNSGTQQWLKTYTSGGNNTDEAYAITLDASGDPIISGTSYVEATGSAMTIVKFSAQNGNQMFVTLGSGSSGSTDVAYAITVDAQDNIYATGYLKTFLDASGNNKSIVTIKLDANGHRRWSKTLSGTGDGDSEPSSMIIDGDANIYITGYVTNNSGAKDIVTVKYDKNGAQKWMKTYNNTGVDDDDMGKKIIMDHSGNILITGSSKHSANDNTEDYMTIKYDINGNTVFSKRYNNTSNSSSIAYSITEYKDDRFYVTGSSRQSSLEGSEDIVTIEYDKNGGLKKTYRISNNGKDAAYDIKADEQGNFVLAGYLNDNSGGMSSQTATNMTCAEYSPGSFNGAQGSGIYNFVYNAETHVSSYTIEKISAEDLTANQLPQKFTLYQNYPNPFNPSTIIKFDVSQASLVKIVIYDVLGKEVLTAVNENMSPGTYEVTVPLSNFSSGLYFYKMTSGDFTDIKKMMLTK